MKNRIYYVKYINNTFKTIKCIKKLPNEIVPLTLLNTVPHLGLRHHLVWLHHHHPQLQAAGRHHLLLPESVCAGILHHASDCCHGRVPARAARQLGDGQLRCAAGSGHSVLWMVHIRLDGLPRRQPAAQSQGAGGVPGVPLLLCDRMDDPDVLAITVEDRWRVR